MRGNNSPKLPIKSFRCRDSREPYEVGNLCTLNDVPHIAEHINLASNWSPSERIGFWSFGTTFAAFGSEGSSMIMAIIGS